MISLLVKQMLEFSMNKQEETAPKSQLWCKYTFAKEQQSSLSNAACPRTVGGPWKVRGNAAELTRRACGWSPDTWWGTLSSLSCFHLFVTHSSCLEKNSTQRTSSPLHLLHTSGHSSRCVPCLKIKVAFIFTSIYPPHIHPQRTQIPSYWKLSCIGLYTKIQNPDYHLVEHLENQLIRKPLRDSVLLKVSLYF